MKVDKIREKGITMVSLIVTIIILIILAGVSINMIVGQDGIIAIAKKAKENMELSQIEEQTKLNELYMQIEKEDGSLGDINTDFLEKINEFKRKIAEYIEEAGGIKPEPPETSTTETFRESILGIVVEVTKDATAKPENITNGKTAYVNGEKITGTMPTLENQTIGTAVAEDILSGKTAWVNGEKITGTMENQGAKTAILNAGQSYTIPAGYHNGQGKITANSLESQTGGTATPDKILKDYTAYVNGKYIVGTMSNNGAVNKTLKAGESYTILPGYHNGSGKVTATDLASQTQGTATAEDIKEGKTAWVNGKLIIGTAKSDLKMLSVMYNHEIDIETITYVDEPESGDHWTSSISNSSQNDWKYGRKYSSQTNLIPLYKTDENGKVYLLYSINYFRKGSCESNNGSFTGGLDVYLYDANGNQITTSHFGRPTVNTNFNNKEEIFSLFEYIITTDAVYITFEVQCGTKRDPAHSASPSWSAGIHNKINLTYYTAKE